MNRTLSAVSVFECGFKHASGVKESLLLLLQGPGLLWLPPEEKGVQRGAAEPLRPHRRVQSLRGPEGRTL